jgi:hypothetical protein
VDSGNLKPLYADDRGIVPKPAEIIAPGSAEIDRCHNSVAYDDGILRISRTGSPPVVAIAGEIDESTYSGLVSTLEELVNGPGEAHVNLAGIRYCDLAGLRAIIGLAGPGSGGPGSGGPDSAGPDGGGPGSAGPDSGGPGSGGQDRSVTRLVLHEVPRHLKTVLEIVGWDTTPGLAIAEPQPPAAACPVAASQVYHLSEGQQSTSRGREEARQ